MSINEHVINSSKYTEDSCMRLDSAVMMKTQEADIEPNHKPEKLKNCLHLFSIYDIN